MPSLPHTFERDERPTSRPIWREAFVGIEWLALRASPVYYGLGVPRGDGAAVVVIPGFLGTDFYLQELYFWLGRVGYKPYMSRIGRNAECLNILVGRLLETVERAYAQTGGKAHLIGHSLGGIIARSTATQRPDLVASVITLGSPFRGVRAHPVVLQAADAVRARIRREQAQRDKPDCYTGYCRCETVTALQSFFPPSVPQTAIYTKDDGIVDWRLCINGSPDDDLEVTGTHVGLAFNPLVYRLIASRLNRA